MTSSHRVAMLVLLIPLVITVAGLLTAAIAILSLASDDSGPNGGSYFQLVVGVVQLACGLAATIVLVGRRRRMNEVHGRTGEHQS